MHANKNKSKTFLVCLKVSCAIHFNLLLFEFPFPLKQRKTVREKYFHLNKLEKSVIVSIKMEVFTFSCEFGTSINSQKRLPAGI